MNPIADIRKDYRMKSFADEDAADAPFAQFQKWWDEAIASDILEVNAMTLATSNKEGKPSARIVLLKGFDENGFQFYSNYESNKALQIEANPQVALIFFWKELERQIRIEGIAVKSDEALSDAYFNSRPIESRIGAWSSPQSQIINDRSLLDKNVEETKQKFADAEITRPPFWGGYTVKPLLFEFWQGRSSRLHDRIEYIKQENNWIKQRLAP